MIDKNERIILYCNRYVERIRTL